MRIVTATALSCLLVASSAGAQIFHSTVGSRHRGGWSFDVGAQMARPVGEFRTNVDRAWGGGLAARYRFGWFPSLALRGDLGFLNYGNERKRVPLSSTLNRVVVEQNTTNNIAMMTFGPEVAVQAGPLRPYAYGFGGWSYFYTESSANDSDGHYQVASSVNFSDAGGAAGYGGGLRIPFRTRQAEVSIDAGARFTRNWTRSYLRPGDITDQPDGSLIISERRTNADFWQFHLGASFAPRTSRRRR
jgi:hypothetical protein